jgi:hypothetical protein
MSDHRKHHLAELGSDATDDQIARAITGYLLNVGNPSGPFKLAYKFDAKSGPPPLHCDRIVQGHTLCAVDRRDKEWCRSWLLQALAKGLYVQRFDGNGYFTPIAGGGVAEARKTIAARERMADFDAKRVLPGVDDEIPF